MSDHYLHALPRLAFVPRLPQLWLHVARQDGDADTLALQDTFEPPRHVAGASVNRKHLGYVEYGARRHVLSETSLGKRDRDSIWQDVVQCVQRVHNMETVKVGIRTSLN